MSTGSSLGCPAAGTSDGRQLHGRQPPAEPDVLRTRFEWIFGRVTGLAKLDDTLARIRGNKNEPLRMLGRPEIPLHINGSENDVRCFVIKRHISGETRSAASKQACDTILNLLKTCSKFAVSFWDYLGDRLKIPETDPVPWLPNLICQRTSAYMTSDRGTFRVPAKLSKCRRFGLPGGHSA
jgi:hypothetical protein